MQFLKPLQKTEGRDRLRNNGLFIEVLDRRINGIGVAESVVQKAGSNRVIIELPGVKDTTEAINMIGKTALLEFKIMDEHGNLGPTLLTGGALKKAQVGYGN